MLMSWGHVADGSPTTAENDARITLGAADGTNEGMTNWGDDSQANPVNAKERTNDVDVMLNEAPEQSPEHARASLWSFDPDGFTLNWTLMSDTSAWEYLYVAFDQLTVVPYSIGTSTANLRSSSGLTISIASGTATFSEPQASNVGIGDKITYNGSTVAYISGRNSPTSYSLKTTVGTTPPDVVGATVDSVTRAFNSLTAANAGSADANHLNLPGPPYDLVAADFQLHWPCYNDGPMNDTPSVSNWTTGPANYIRIYAPFRPDEVGARQRHTGIEGTGFRLGPVIASPPQGIALMTIGEEYVRVEGIEIDGSGVTDARSYRGLHVASAVTTTSDVRVDGLIIHDIHVTNSASTGYTWGVHVDGAAGTGARASISNSMVYDVTNPFSNFVSHVTGIAIWSANTSYVYNNTVYHIRNTGPTANGAAWGIQALTNGSYSNTVFAKNNYVGDVRSDNDPVSNCYDQRNAGATLDQQSNVSSDGTGNVINRAAYGSYFVNANVGSEDLHLLNKSNVLWGSFGTDVTTDPNLPVKRDIDWQGRNPAEPEMGADQFLVATAVELLSFEARGLDGAVELSWQTGSELNNLGFHLHRAVSAEGPYQRITASLVPGLGSSPIGASYSYLDGGLANGVTYSYRLEDIETTGATKLHGPVSAMPQATAPQGEPSPGDGGSGSGGGGGSGGGSGSGGGGEPGGGSGSGGARIVYGDPTANGLQVRQVGPGEAVIELITEGFYAIPQPDGTVRLEVPGFEESGTPGAPAIPSRRAWLEAVAGRRVELASVRALEVSSYPELRLAATGVPELEVGAEGTVKAGRRRRVEGEAFRRAGLYPAEAARLLGVAFQGEVKKAELELSPLRWDGASRQLVVARRLEVRVVFSGKEARERALGGSRGRLEGEGRVPATRGLVLAQLVTRAPGIYGVRYEEVFAPGTRGRATSGLNLSRQGKAVAFHVEPERGRFGPGSVLYFLSEGASLNPYGQEAVYELSQATGGLAMGVQKAAPASASVSHYRAEGRWEQDRTYQAGLLEAEDLWQWEAVLSRWTRSYPFTLSGVSPSGEPPSLTVWLQGGSDFEADPDHHVRIWVNGAVVGEASWDGMRPRRLEVELPSGLLIEGANQLVVENAGDTAATYSVVYLDKFRLGYSRRLVAEGGLLRGSFAESGRAEVGGLGAGAVVVETSGARPRWVRGVTPTGEGLSFGVEAGRSYWAGEVLGVEVRRPLYPGLKDSGNRAEYLVVGPREFLGEAQGLLERRASQGLAVKAVAIEDVYEEFGRGEGRPEAVREFLSYAYHRWSAPTLRYVLLLGDATFDFKDNYKTGQANQVPPLMVKTSYLWTASDPTYGAVNGEDGLPDVAIGRLSARTVEEARVLVSKVLDFEESGLSFSGRAVLVADNADVAGEFEANSDAVGALLGEREIERIYLRDLGRTAMRPAIMDALNRGASLLSYVGHGAVAIWASENVFNIMDVRNLAPQAQQPLLMTMNCLNGYIPMPGLNSLGEEMVKAEGKGAIAAFSPSGLSLDAPAHLYQRALVTELTSGRHRRLGDAVLAAQAVYADTGAFPELLAIYHLLGDPALELR
jgi:uncharacterized membrane protein YgcG